MKDKLENARGDADKAIEEYLGVALGQWESSIHLWHGDKQTFKVGYVSKVLGIIHFECIECILLSPL